jgi:UPF0755 protein
MSVRGGGSPRDGGSREGSGRGRDQAHPLAETAPPTGRTGSSGSTPPRQPMPGSARPRRSEDPHAGHGLLRFAVFAIVMVALVGVLAVTVLRPVAVSAVSSWAKDNPATWRLPFVGDLVRESLQSDLATKASDDPTEVAWSVETGDTVDRVADRLVNDGLVVSKPAFRYAAWERDLAAHLEAGTFRLRRDMTPDEVARALIEDRIVITTAPVTFREGLRLEQITAKLQTIDSGVDPKAFYDLVTKPPAALLADYPWLKLPKGATLEGFLYPATYTLRTDSEAPTTAEGLVRMMLDQFYQQVGPQRMQVPDSRGLSFYEVLTLASIVEREAALDVERPIIAGVYQNRLDTRPYLLNADPTVIYASDTVALRDLPFDEWKGYTFWKPLGQALAKVELPADLLGYQTYTQRGLPPGPIATPTVASIDAALEPDTEAGYFYFVLIPDGGGKHDFAKTYAQHLANLKKYGYR